jgi:hypothetical protein
MLVARCKCISLNSIRSRLLLCAPIFFARPHTPAVLTSDRVRRGRRPLRLPERLVARHPRQPRRRRSRARSPLVLHPPPAFPTVVTATRLTLPSPARLAPSPGPPRSVFPAQPDSLREGAGTLLWLWRGGTRTGRRRLRRGRTCSSSWAWKSASKVSDAQVGASLRTEHVRRGGDEGGQSSQWHRGGLSTGAVYHQMRHSASEKRAQDARGWWREAGVLGIE